MSAVDSMIAAQVALAGSMAASASAVLTAATSPLASAKLSSVTSAGAQIQAQASGAEMAIGIPPVYSGARFTAGKPPSAD